MKPYPKNIYQTAALIQKYKDAGLVITDDQKVETALNEIGFYRLRGYSFHLYDNATKKYIPNVTFDTICHIYNFDMELRSLLFGMTCKIEVALRSRFCEALLQKNDALIYLDPSIFKDKAIFWRNTASISSEIARSTDVFITHNYDNHDGQIPLWAAVEVMSYGKLPTMKDLRSEKELLVQQKDTQYETYQYFKDYHRELQTVCSNVASILNQPSTQKRTKDEHTL